VKIDRSALADLRQFGQELAIGNDVEQCRFGEELLTLLDEIEQEHQEPCEEKPVRGRSL